MAVGVTDRLVRGAENAPVARMDHFEPLVAGAGLAKAAQARAARQLLFLRGAEMEETQGDATGAVDVLVAYFDAEKTAALMHFSD